MEWNDWEVNRAFSAGTFSLGPMNPGALPQARVELRAFGAQRKNSLRLLVANTHVDIPRTRLIYSLL
jgi:hypothetical protein